MKTPLISIDDCILTRLGQDIMLILPKVVDHTCVPPISGTLLSGDTHNHYPNKFGDMVIACDYVPRFYAPSDFTKERYGCGFFEGRHVTPVNLATNRFVYERSRAYLNYFPEEGVDYMPVAQRIAILGDEIAFFVAWANEFLKIHGEQCLKDPTFMLREKLLSEASGRLCDFIQAQGFEKRPDLIREEVLYQRPGEVETFTRMDLFATAAYQEFRQQLLKR